MVKVIQFPRKPLPEPSVTTLDQTIDLALASYLKLSESLDGVMNQLETNLARLSAALPAQPKHLADQHARQVSDLERQLAHARQMMEGIRQDITRLNPPPRK